MRITGIEVYILTGPEDDRPHWVSHFVVPRGNDLLVRLRTDDGLEGIGLASSNNAIKPAAALFGAGLAERVLGADPRMPEKLYEKLFALTYQRASFERGWNRDALILAGAAIDIAMWDLLGKISNQPLYRLFGGYTDEVPCYVTCAYYREGKDLGELRAEMDMLRGQGHRAFKAKIGGMSLAQDMARLEVIRDCIGDEALLMVDVNRGWSLQTAIEGARALEAFKPRWLEEPVRWMDDRNQLRLLAAQTAIPLSAGESEITAYGCRDLLGQGAISVLQFDCTRMGGFTMGRKLAATAELFHVQVAPHHDCFLHAHIVASSPSGLIVESFTDPERDPLQAELFANAPRIADGILTLNDAPGLGLDLNPSALAQFGERVFQSQTR